MLKRSRFLLLGAFVCAVAAGTFLSPASVCATTGGCPFPTQAVSMYFSTTGNNIENSLSDDIKRCKEQCDEMKNGCHGVADAAEQCLLESGGAESGADERGCQDLPKPQSGDCRQSVRGSLSDFTDFVKDNTSSAKADCDAAGDSCEASCGQSED